MKLKLDAKTTAALALSKGRNEEIAWDAELEGFGFRVRRRSDGRLHRTWVTQYRAGGRTRRITVGSAERLTPSEARQAARKLLARVELGEDPRLEPRPPRQTRNTQGHQRRNRSRHRSQTRAVKPVVPSRTQARAVPILGREAENSRRWAVCARAPASSTTRRGGVLRRQGPISRRLQRHRNPRCPGWRIWCDLAAL